MTTGRTVVVTGGSSGIGAAGALALARRGDEVVLVGRTPRRLDRVARRIERATGTAPATHRADFTDLGQVRALGAELLEAHPRIDVLANNAGRLVGLRHQTVDGHERTIQVNHLAGFLLAHLLLPALRAAAAVRGHARIITTTSLAEAIGSVDPADLSGRSRVYSRWWAYGTSKQANVLFTVEAARRWAPLGVIATCFHPAIARTRFGWTSAAFAVGKAHPLILPAGVAARGMVHLATGPDGLVPGFAGFLGLEWPPTARSTDPVLAAALWEASLDAVGLPRHGDGDGDGDGDEGACRGASRRVADGGTGSTFF